MIKNSSTDSINTVKIGFFDSGHGGLGLLREAMSRGLKAEFYYLADLEHLPYGEKSQELIQKRCLSIGSFLQEQGCTAIVVACNTATAHGVDLMRQNLSVPVVAVEPYLNYINKLDQDLVGSGAKEDLGPQVIAALVTPRTFESARLKALQQKIDPLKRIDVLPMPGLATLIEELIAKRDKVSFEKKLFGIVDNIGNSYSTLLLGCTHYPLISKFIEARLNVMCVSPTSEVIDQLQRVLKIASQQESVQKFLYTSSESKEWKSKSIEDFIFWD